MFSNYGFRLFVGGCAAIFGAKLAIKLAIPLPWLLGPLFTVAFLRLLSAPISTYKPLRNIGQWIIGVTLGLYFSPDIARLVIEHWLVLVLGIVIAMALAACGTWLLCKVGNVDIRTAWFSAAIGGASEMSVLADKYGARVDLVASAHSLRVLGVVSIIPFAFDAFGLRGLEAELLLTSDVNFWELMVVAVLATVVGAIFYWRGVASAWVIGPLLGAAVLTIFEVSSTSMPIWIVNLGQLLLGWSLGDRYRQEFFKSAPRFLTAVAIYTLSAILITTTVGFLISPFSSLPQATIWLGLAPGGFAEMAITAKVLMLGVPMVTAFQVSRMTFVVLSTGWLYQRVIAPKFGL
jgi:membrane AbrB-like protein